MATKEDLVRKIAEKSKLTKAASEKALNACLEAVYEDLAQGDNLKLTGFGSFSVVERKSRKGRNPQTGEEITIPASRTVKFSPGKNLKENISG
ncbi:MAG TPA: HU family DNA-binding protein [Desulfohalobiaceae bacterium]|nr:HU family DNA-binding protein [Desulfohalobiaceae bacterium]